MWRRDFVRLQLICHCAPWGTLIEYKHSSALLHSTRTTIIAVSVEDAPAVLCRSLASDRLGRIRGCEIVKRALLPCCQCALPCFHTCCPALTRLAENLFENDPNGGCRAPPPNSLGAHPAFGREYLRYFGGVAVLAAIRLGCHQTQKSLKTQVFPLRCEGPAFVRPHR